MTDGLYEGIFKVAEALETPVIVVTLLALAVVIAEAGAFVVELLRRRRRRSAALLAAGRQARAAVDEGRRQEAESALADVAWSGAMASTYRAFLDAADTPTAEPTMAKELADFDFGRQRRLARTRLLVRSGPALGLMGTLIPLSPALDGLARGNLDALTHNLRLAFSITVLGLFIGVVAFAISLVRDRLYGQDRSDLEYVAVLLSEGERP